MLLLKKLLLLLTSACLWQESISDSQIKNIVSPTIDFSSNQLGSMAITFIWQGSFIPTQVLADLKARVTFPFALTAPLRVEWIQVNEACIVSSNTVATTSYASTIPGDPSGAHFFDMVGANYFSGALYKLVLRIQNTADIPTSVGNTDPIKFELVSSDKPNLIVFAYNYNFGYLRIATGGSSNFELDLTKSFEDSNLYEFTRDFTARANVRIFDLNVSRILFKLDNYAFSDDAESTCNSEPDDSVGIPLLPRANFYCQFEDNRKLGLYFIWQEGVYPPIGQTFRLRFRVKNPDKPSSTSLSIAMFERYSPKVLKFRNIPNAFSCGATNFGAQYPKLFVGPTLDASSPFYPNLTLFTKGDKTNSITFNTIKVQFMVNLDLPAPAVSYTLNLKVLGNTDTTVPKSLVYHDLPVAFGFKNVKIVVDPATGNLQFQNVGQLTSLLLYTIGFKVGFHGSEAGITFIGPDSFGAISITDNTGLVTIVNKKAPPNLNAAFKSNPATNVHPAATQPLNILTFMHSRPSGSLDTTYSHPYITTAANKAVGMSIGTNQDLVLGYEFNTGTWSTPPVAGQTFLEVITTRFITATPVVANDNWSNAQAGSNCNVRLRTTGVSQTLSIQSCLYTYMNKGLQGSEYARFRMGGTSAANFWGPPSSGTTRGAFVWRGVIIPVSSSLFADGVDSAVLDFYVATYSDAFTNDIKTAYFARGRESVHLINGHVVNPTHLSTMSVSFHNYIRTAAISLTGSTVPTILRVSGFLDGINPARIRKLVLFFQSITAIPLDPDNPIEVGCGTSATATVSCSFYQGVDSTICQGGAACTNYLSMNRLEILMSTTIGSIADVYQIHIAIPVVIPVGTGHIYQFYAGTSSQYEGSLSTYPDMTYMNYYLPTFTACNTCPGSINTAPASMATSLFSRITSQTSPAGSLMNSLFEYNCQVAACTVGTPTKDYFSLTFCSTFNFMSNAGFSVTNGVDVFEQCVPGITYLFGAAPYTTKYCLFCPQFSSGTTGSSYAVSNFQTPWQNGLLLPTGTHMSISGIQSYNVATPKYGLQSVIDQSALGTFSSTNFITNFAMTPATIYYDTAVTAGTGANNIELNLTLTLANPVPVNGYIRITSVLDFPFSWITVTPPGTSTFCTIWPNNIPCTVNIQSTTAFFIRPSVQLSATTITLSLSGLRTVKVQAPALPNVHTFTATTYTSSGVAANNVIDTSSTLASLELAQYMDTTVTPSVAGALNILKLKNLQLAEAVVGYRTTLSIDVILGNDKKFLSSDVLSINLNGGAYVPSDVSDPQPVYCEITALGSTQVLSQFTTCSVQDLANILVTAQANTPYNSFTLRIMNYIVKATSTASPLPTGRVYFAPDNTVTLQAQIAADPEPAWPSSLAVSGVITSVAVAKQLSYYGLRMDLTFTITPATTAITYETRIYIQFPAAYNAGFGSFPISCYLEGSSSPEKLYCWRYADRTLAITGFRTNTNPGSSVIIKVYGVQQPLSTGSERFFVAIDADGDPKSLSEMKPFTVVATPLSVANIVPRIMVLSSQYSHNFIRASNSFLVTIECPVTITAGSFIIVYMDYLEHEFDIAGFTGTCTIKPNQLAADQGNGCIRQGNRYKISVKTSLTANLKYTILIEDIPTPDFASCKVKRPEIYVVDASNSLVAFSTDVFQNTDLANFLPDPAVTYFTFDGLTPSKPITFIKGIYNNISFVKMDKSRFNDDFNVSLTSSENGIFTTIDPSTVETKFGHFGSQSVSTFLASSLNSFTNQISVTYNFSARFQKTGFAKLPVLRVMLTNAKTTLILPASLKVYPITNSMLPFYARLRELPLSDTTFTVSFVDIPNLVANPSTFTLGATKRAVKIRITGPPGTIGANPQIVITPSGQSGYGPSVIPLNLQPASAATDASNPDIRISSSESISFGYIVDISSKEPLSFYTIAMPANNYRLFSKDYILQKYEANNRTDGKYFIDYGISDGTNVLNLAVNTKDLRSKQDYTITFYGETLSGSAQPTFTLNLTTAESAGGFGYVNLTFADKVDNSMKPQLMCIMAQIFAFPIEK